MSADVLVVGAGLAGLACALHLSEAGLGVEVLEASDAVGGRIRTDRVDGYLIDRGFQVFNTAYPEARRVLDLPGLNLCGFDRAVEIEHEGTIHRLAEPWREPGESTSLLTAPIGSPLERLALARYAAAATATPSSRLLRRPDRPALDDLAASGVRDEPLERLIRPFLAGVLLEDELTTSSRFVRMVVRTFARGTVAVPAVGMQQIPEQLATKVGRDAVRLGVDVTSVTAGRVHHSEGRDTARAVVVATDGDTAARFLGSDVVAPTWNGVRTYFHATDVAPSARATLRLPGGPSPLLNSVVMTAAAPGYAPAGRALVATSVLHGEGRLVPELETLRPYLDALWRTDTSKWDTVAVRDVPYALPAMPAPHRFAKPVRVSAGLYVCGDHRDTSSIQGALVSGRRAAEAVLADLGVS